MNQKGFSLIELMVAMVVGLFLIGGVVSVFTNVSNSTRIQENMARMQENARFSLFFLNKDLRQAGYFGGPCVSAVAESINNILDEGNSNYNPSVHLFNSDTLLNAIDGKDASGTIFSGVPYSDSVTVKAIFDQAGGVMVTDPMQGVEKDLLISTDLFKKGSIVLVTDCSRGDVFEVDKTPSQVTSTSDPLKSVYSLSHKMLTTTQTTSGPGNKVDALSYNYQAGSYVFPLPSSRTFVVKNNQLLRNDTPIADDIDDMAIYYGVATPGSDGSPSYYAKFSQVTTPENIVSVKIKLLVRSSEDNVTASPQTYTFDGNTFLATDRRLRKEFVTTITLRNRVY